jgi:hypothetical protein
MPDQIPSADTATAGPRSKRSTGSPTEQAGLAALLSR